METKEQGKVYRRSFLTHPDFPARGGKNWVGPLVDYKEVELMRRCMTTSSKVMSRKRTGTNAQVQKSLQRAIKQARFMALISYCGP